MKFPHPLFQGDTVHVRTTEVVGKRESTLAPRCRHRRVPARGLQAGRHAGGRCAAARPSCASGRPRHDIAARTSRRRCRARCCSCPASDERKLAKALGSGADLLILDLEDSVAPDAKPAARDERQGLSRRRMSDASAARPALCPRQRLRHRPHRRRPCRCAAAAAGRHHAAQGDLRRRRRRGLPPASMPASRPRACAGAHPASSSSRPKRRPALLQMHSFAGASLASSGMTWGAEDLGTAIGASTARDAVGAFTPPFRAGPQSVPVRGLCRRRAGRSTPSRPISATRRLLEREARRPPRDGFTAKLAIHPAQVPIINAAFTPSGAEIAEARAVVEAFESAGNRRRHGHRRAHVRPAASPACAPAAGAAALTSQRTGETCTCASILVCE